MNKFDTIIEGVLSEGNAPTVKDLIKIITNYKDLPKEVTDIIEGAKSFALPSDGSLTLSDGRTLLASATVKKKEGETKGFYIKSLEIESFYVKDDQGKSVNLMK